MEKIHPKILKKSDLEDKFGQVTWGFASIFSNTESSGVELGFGRTVKGKEWIGFSLCVRCWRHFESSSKKKINKERKAVGGT